MGAERSYLLSDNNLKISNKEKKKVLENSQKINYSEVSFSTKEKYSVFSKEKDIAEMF